MATYADLAVSMEYYSDRSDITESGRAMMFRSACEKMNRGLRAPEMISTLSLTGADFPYTDTTYAIMEVDAVYVTRSSNTYRLDYVPVSQLKAIQAAGSGDVPRYFSTVGNQIILGPEPAATDAIEVVYYARQDDTLSGVETNAFLQYYESIALYYTLAELYRVLHDVQRAGEYEAMAAGMMAEANLVSWKRKYPTRLSIKNS